MASYLPKSYNLLHFPSVHNRVVHIVPPLQAEHVKFYDTVMQNLRSFWVRKWYPIDLLRLVLFTFIHVLCIMAPFHFTWPAFWVFIALYIITGLFGMTLSFHRHLTHKCFNLPKWLEYTFAYCGIIAGQGNPIDWVSMHRYHHEFTDTAKDPHSPIEGFWFSHMNWMMDRQYATSKCGEPNNVNDLKSQLFYRFIEKTYYLHGIAIFVLLYVVGGAPFLIWGGGVRVAAFLHATMLVNSVGHIWGTQAWNTENSSRNNWWLALITFGEGWHNNHHAFVSSAKHGLEWWQIDVTWGVIRFLEAVGLATNVKLPSEAQMKRMKRTCSINK